MKLPIYMDYHATTPVDPRVVEAMLPYFHEHFGNAASRNHSFGWAAEEAVETARKQVAAVKVGKRPRGIGFTPDGKLAYVACELANQVHVIDTAARKVVAV